MKVIRRVPGIYYFSQVTSPHFSGKTGKIAKKSIPCLGKHREFGNLTKPRETPYNCVYAQAVISLVLKVKVIAIVCLSFFVFFSQKPNVSLKSVLHMKQSQINELA